MMKYFIIIICLTFDVQAQNPMHFVPKLNIQDDNTYVVLNYTIDDNWSVYGYHVQNQDNYPKIYLNNILTASNWPKAITQSKGGIISHFLPKDGMITFDNPLMVTTDFKIKYYACNTHCNIFEDNFTVSVTKQSHTLIWMLFLAFIGGIILNIMPCVLPIISSKIVYVIKKSTYNIKLHSTYIILGIMLGFMGLATIVVFFKLLGKNIGWGLHFQNPVFTIIILLICLISALSYLNCLGKKSYFKNLLNKILPSNIIVHDIFHGIIVVLFATPCTAPLITTSIAFAMTQSIWVIFAIYFCIGLGMTTPYLFLLICGNAYLPKPGKWLRYIDKFIGIIFILISLWFSFILFKQIQLQVYYFVLATITLFCFLLSKKSLYTVCVIYLPLIFMPPNNDQWIAFDETILEQAIKDQKIIIVNITADWCTTCKINEMTIFNDKFIQTNSNIILMKGDFTNYSDELKKYIDKYHSPGIPLTVIYGPNHPNGIAMSTLLNEKEITETLAKLS